jgi:hypothetical protein
MLLVLTVSLLTWVSACHTADGRMQDATLSVKDGVPCMGVDVVLAEAKGEGVVSLVVNERSKDGVRSIWEIIPGVVQDHLRLDAETRCISYARVPQGAQARIAAEALQPGRRYEVDIMVDQWNAAAQESRVRHYLARLCLASGVNGKGPVPHRVIWDEQGGVWRWDICGLDKQP